MKYNTTSITVQQLRKLLFEIANQEMTVRELRLHLFNRENQDLQVNDENIDALISAELAQLSADSNFYAAEDHDAAGDHDDEELLFDETFTDIYQPEAE